MSRPIQLHGDLSVDPAREAEMLHYFETVYRPAAAKFPGYIDLHLLKLTGVPAGTAPAGLRRMKQRLAPSRTSSPPRLRAT